MNLTALLFSNPAYKVLGAQIMYPLFIGLGLIGLFLSYKKWSSGAIWLVLFIFGFLLVRIQGVNENLPETFLTEPNFSNTFNSYISMMIGVLINFVGLFIKRKEKTLQ
ncbi:MAG TPA: hypothetical protein VNI84_12940 [Pyrinomonadaceae bacterium]|nr:hypothetical protein [Pyrinomonadaceae bacterium]